MIVKIIIKIQETLYEDKAFLFVIHWAKLIKITYWWLNFILNLLKLWIDTQKLRTQTI